MKGKTNIKKTVLWILLVLLPVCLGGCKKATANTEKRELLIYCGITMTLPVAEIAGIIEEQENCTIRITKGGSGNLLKAINMNKVGDLYLPGSDSYMKTCVEEGIVTESVHVGYNKAALMVQKGNPRNIPADLDALTSKDYYVVIGNPDSGSVGRETKKILSEKGIFDKVLNNARMLTTDSKDLIRVLKDKEADIVINWYAASTWDDTVDYVDVLPINEQYAQKKNLVIGLLTYSKHKDIARKFMEYASSEKGKAIFNKYGLYDIE